MKGYLSQIAMQSGLRFWGEGGRSLRRTGELRAGTLPAPLDRQETVMVPPSVKTKSADAGVLKRDSSSELRTAETAEPKQDRSKKLAGTVREKAAAESVDETPAAHVSKAANPADPRPANPRRMEALSSGKSPASNAAETKPIEIVKTIYVKPSAKTEQNEKQTQDNAPTPPKGLEQRPGKNYFSKTAEIIGGRHAEPVEAQTILLREIQEWVAAGTMAEAKPRVEAGRSAEPVEPGDETVETQEAASMTERAPGVVRICEKRHRESIPNEASRIEEQSFDLSIGTISVVIEGDERPPQPIPAPRAESGRTGELQATRRSSRLDRNYL